LFTRIEIGHTRISSAGYGRIRSRGLSALADTHHLVAELAVFICERVVTPVGSTTRIDPHAPATVMQLEVFELALPAGALP